MQPQYDLRVFQVEGSVVRLNDNVLLFSSPASTDWEDETRHEMTHLGQLRQWPELGQEEGRVLRLRRLLGHDRRRSRHGAVDLRARLDWGPGPGRQRRQLAGLLRRDRHGADQPALAGQHGPLRVRLVLQRRSTRRHRRLSGLGRARLWAVGSTGLGSRIQLQCGRPLRGRPGRRHRAATDRSDGSQRRRAFAGL